jgi:hypothetical protein
MVHAKVTSPNLITCKMMHQLHIVDSKIMWMIKYMVVCLTFPQSDLQLVSPQWYGFVIPHNELRSPTDHPPDLRIHYIAGIIWYVTND